MESANTTTLIISNDAMEDIIKIVKYLEDSGLLLKWVTKTTQNEVKKKKKDFLGTLGESLLGNILAGKGINRSGKGCRINWAGEGTVRAGYGNHSTKMDF